MLSESEVAADLGVTRTERGRRLIAESLAAYPENRDSEPLRAYDVEGEVILTGGSSKVNVEWVRDAYGRERFGARTGTG